MANAAQIAEKWARNMGNSGSAIAEGVDAVTESPMEAAIKQKANWVRGIQEAATNGKWEAGLRRVSLPDWKLAMKEKGVPNILRGVTMAKPKFQSFMTKLLAHQETIANELRSMPRGDFQTNINRMILNATRMREFKND